MTVPCVTRGDIDEAQYHSFAKAGRVAWDIETSGLDWQQERIGTCQIYAPEVGSVVVQIGSDVPNQLRQLLAHPGVEKVFHHAPFDLRFMVWHWKVEPRNVMCTKVASRLLDPHAPDPTHSLQSLLRDRLGVVISKDQRRTDWTADKLTPAQLTYAARDVEHLLPLYEDMLQRLRNAGLDDLYRSCCRFLPARVQLELGDWPDVFAY